MTINPKYIPLCIFDIGRLPKLLEREDSIIEIVSNAVEWLSHKSILFCQRHYHQQVHILPTLALVVRPAPFLVTCYQSNDIKLLYQF